MKKLLSVGVEGGGFDVFEIPDTTIVEMGSSGGILTEDEDPHRKWKKKFATVEDWWTYFTSEHGYHWIHFSLLFIDVSVKAFVLQKVKEFDSTNNSNDFHKNRWLEFIEQHSC